MLLPAALMLLSLSASAGGTYTLKPGQSQTLSFTPHEGGFGFVWTSADPSTVEISSQSGATATVKALRARAGSVPVVCKYKYTVTGTSFSYDEEVNESFSISVPLEVTGIVIDSRLSLFTGDRYEFSPVIEPAGATTSLSWESSNNAVASIDQSGVLTANGAGQAVITARAATGHKASCTVSVRDRSFAFASTYPSEGLHCYRPGMTPAIVFNENIRRGADFDKIILRGPDDALIAGEAVICANAVVFVPSEELKAEGYYFYEVPAGAVESLYGESCGREYMNLYVKSCVNVEQVDFGSYFTLMLKSDGTLWFAGKDQYHIGNSGSGADAFTLSFRQIDSNVAKIAAGCDYYLMLRNDGALWAAGNNEGGQLGDGSKELQLTPVKIMDDVADIAARESHSLAIKNDGTLWSWGSCFHGIGNGTDESAIPVKVLDDAVKVAAGKYHSLAIKSDGSLWAWGSNSYGEIGDNSGNDQLYPVKVLDGDVTAISGGNEHSLILKSNGTMWGCGNSSNYQLARKTLSVRTYTQLLDDVSSILASTTNSFAVRTDGSLWGCGGNHSHSILPGNGMGVYSFTQVSDKVSNVYGSAYFGPSAIVRDDGSLWMWGNNEHALYGNGTKTSSEVPLKIVDGMSAISPTAIKLSDRRIAPGMKCFLAPELTPATADYETIEWSTTDSGVASIDKYGIVSATAEGEATISARITAFDGTELEASCRVTVDASAGTSTVRADSPADSRRRIFSLDGREIPSDVHPAAGIYIINEDGKTRKSIVR